jgi:hypothetical protein
MKVSVRTRVTVRVGCRCKNHPRKIRYRLSQINRCNICRNIIRKAGALVFSPPDAHMKSSKIHVCVDCWKPLSVLLNCELPKRRT